MPKKAYECGCCNEVHDYESSAEDCCRPEVNEVWTCDLCSEAHSEKEDAVNCCVGKVKTRGADTVRCPSCYRDQELVQHAVEIEVAGHCSECNPHFSIEQSFAIGDLVDERIAEVMTP